MVHPINPNNQLMVHKGIWFTSIGSRGRTTNWEWNSEHLDFKKWLRHFCEVLHHPRIDKIMFNGDNLDDIEPVQKVIKGLQIGCLGIWDELTNEFAKKVLKSFPNYEKLFLGQVSFGSHELNKVLNQNLKSISVPDANEIKIDQVLMSNSVRIQLKNSLFTEKDFNRLLKLWIRGSSPRLNYFFTWGRPQLGNTSFDMKLILKGIKHNQIPLASEEDYRDDTYENYSNYHNTKLAGGCRIWRFNGDTAVIVVTQTKFEFIVE